MRGKGAYVFDENGNRYIDAISSWWVNLHGHCHPYINEKIKVQLETLEHVIFAGYTHPQAIELAERLLALTSLDKVFFSDNGSTAIESALKMVLQAKGGGKIVSFKSGYHGDTFGAMSAAGKNHFNKPFWPYLFEVETIDPPLHGQEDLTLYQFDKIKDPVAFIFEPHLQGSGGMVTHSLKGLKAMIRRCQEKGIITIADEVMTGFGRTGPLFISSELNPDILCLSKGITGGYLPLGATLVKEKCCFYEDVFLHGHSYTANPLACAAANASLDLLLSEECQKARSFIQSQHEQFKKKIQVKRCEVIGTILIVEIDSTASYFNPIKDQLYHFFLNRGILIRPLGNVLYIMPPYCIGEEDLQHIYSTIYEYLTRKNY